MRQTLVAAFALAALLLGACSPGALPTKEYAYPAWGFRASFPSPPVETAKPGAPDGSQPNSGLVEATGSGRDFAVWAADVSKSNMSLDDLASNAADHVARGMGAAVGVRTYAATGDGVLGREFQLTQGDKWVMTVRVFLAGGKFYEVIAKSDRGKDDPAVQAFLTSFHTLGAAPAAANATPSP
jgi:hypothetical protein